MYHGGPDRRKYPAGDVERALELAIEAQASKSPGWGGVAAVALSGAPGVTRTRDLLVRSQTLYPTELRALAQATNPSTVANRAGVAQPRTPICHNGSVAMTDRLYYTDSYLRQFTARIVERSEDGSTVYLDRTAFYPASGGQPCDTGAIAGVPVLDVADAEERIAHYLAAPLDSTVVECAIDWSRRFDHMQQHTGQHVLSAVFEEWLGLHTVSFHLGAESSTIDLEGGAVESGAVLEAERRANDIVFANRPVAVAFQHAAEVHGLRKPTDREGTLRIVSIQGLVAPESS